MGEAITKEREQQIRASYQFGAKEDEPHFYRGCVGDLLAEIDRLRAGEQVAPGLWKAIDIVEQEIHFQVQGTDAYLKCIQIRDQLRAALTALPREPQAAPGLRESELLNLVDRIAKYLALGGTVALKDSMNPLEALLWDCRAALTVLPSTPREPHLPTIETSSATDYLPPSFTAAAPPPVPPRLRCAACGKWFTVASPQREQEETVTAIENWQGDAVSQCRIDASISDLAPAPVKDAPRGDRWVDIHTGKEVSDTAKDAPQFPPEVIAGIEEGRAAVRRGETIPWEQVRGTGSDARGRAACQTQAVPNPAAPREAQLAQMCETFVDEFCGGSETVMGILMMRIADVLAAAPDTPSEGK